MSGGPASAAESGGPASAAESGGPASAAESGGPWLWRAGLAIAVRPRLWSVALVQLFRLSPTGWWRRWPPFPVPDPAYMRFRAETAYGDSAHPPDAHDVVAYLNWCRRSRRFR